MTQLKASEQMNAVVSEEQQKNTNVDEALEKPPMGQWRGPEGLRPHRDPD